MKAILLFCLFWVAFLESSFAQEIPVDTIPKVKPYRNSVYAEFLGSALLGSLNYERLIHFPNSTESMALRAGLLLVPVTEDDKSRMLNVFVPLEVTFLLGNKEVRPEFGAGTTLMHRYPIGGAVRGEKSREFMPVVRAGCRYTPENGPFFFRFSLHVFATGYHKDYHEGSVFPWIGSCVGYTFGK